MISKTNESLELGTEDVSPTFLQRYSFLEDDYSLLGEESAMAPPSHGGIVSCNSWDIVRSHSSGSVGSWVVPMSAPEQNCYPVVAEQSVNLDYNTSQSGNKPPLDISPDNPRSTEKGNAFPPTHTRIEDPDDLLEVLPRPFRATDFGVGHDLDDESWDVTSILTIHSALLTSCESLPGAFGVNAGGDGVLSGRLRRALPRSYKEVLLAAIEEDAEEQRHVQDTQDITPLSRLHTLTRDSSSKFCTQCVEEVSEGGSKSSAVQLRQRLRRRMKYGSRTKLSNKNKNAWFKILSSDLPMAIPE